MCPMPLRHIDVGNAAFDGLMETRKSRAVPPGAVVVMVSMEAIMMLDYKRASVVLKELWDICDPSVIQSHPDEAFKICLRALVKEFAETLLLPNSTKTEFRMAIRVQIRQYKRDGLFSIGFT
jgi:hypothetical protein